MRSVDRFHIGGAWVAPIGDRVMPIKNPADDNRIGTLALGAAADVDRAVAAAKEAFESFARTGKRDRLGLLRRLLEITKRRRDELARAITAEMGAPATMSRNVQAESGVRLRPDPPNDPLSRRRIRRAGIGSRVRSGPGLGASAAGS